MFRQPLTLAAALSMALLIYVAFIVLILQRIHSLMQWCMLTAAPASPPIFSNGWIRLFGFSVRFEMLVILGSIAPTWWLTSAVFRKVRRHNREKLGACLECGCPLPATRGRCLSCGTRYERIGRDQPSFPVLFR